MNFPQHDVAICHGQRAAPAIAGRTWNGAGAVWADAITGPVKMQDRTSTGGNCMYAHHRCPHSNTGHLGFEDPFVLTIIMRDICRCPTHIKADDLVETGYLCGADHADNAPSGPGQDAVLALEFARVCQPAV